jgi:predicted metal-dependent hydrolase
MEIEGLGTVAYQLNRKTFRRSVTITVSEENEVLVTAPKFLSRNEIERILQRKSSWIKKRFFYNLEWKDKHKPKKFLPGEKFLFLGREHVLEIEKGDLRGILPEEGVLRLRLPKEEFAAPDLRSVCASMIKAWYEGVAYQILAQRVAVYEEKLGVKANKINVKELKSLWGSCSVKRILNFNWRIVMAPLNILDYLVVHELSHLIHQNHSPRFWETVAAAVPEHHKARKWLRQNARRLSL